MVFHSPPTTEIPKSPKKLSWKKKSGNTAFCEKTWSEKKIGKHSISKFFSGNTSIATFVFPTSRLSTFRVSDITTFDFSCFQLCDFFFREMPCFPKFFFRLSFFEIPEFFFRDAVFPDFFFQLSFFGISRIREFP